MKFTIKDPIDNSLLELTAVPEDYNGQPAWRILFPEKDSFVMLEKNQEWTVIDETDINPDLINAIAGGLKPHSRYSSLT